MSRFSQITECVLLALLLLVAIVATCGAIARGT
jgi:hypothetical protein